MRIKSFYHPRVPRKFDVEKYSKNLCQEIHDKFEDILTQLKKSFDKQTAEIVHPMSIESTLFTKLAVTHFIILAWFCSEKVSRILKLSWAYNIVDMFWTLWLVSAIERQAMNFLSPRYMYLQVCMYAHRGCAVFGKVYAYI